MILVYIFDENQKLELVKSKDVKNECQFIRTVKIEEILVKSKDVKNRLSVYSNNEKKSRQKATSQNFFRQNENSHVPEPKFVEENSSN